MTKQHSPGTMNSNQNSNEIGKQGSHNDIEVTSQYNKKSKSQKKSGK